MHEDGAIIRSESVSDVVEIRALHDAAFGQTAEGALVDALRESGDVVLSLVAVEAGRLVGHIVFSRMQAPFRAVGLGPVAVLPDRQGRGIGSRLIRAGLMQVRNEGWQGVFVVGEPGFYQRFGFSAERASGFQSRYSGPFLMALSLAERNFPSTTGRIEYAPAFAALPW